jgi:hypothetical protein
MEKWFIDTRASDKIAMRPADSTKSLADKLSSMAEEPSAQIGEIGTWTEAKPISFILTRNRSE